MTHEQLLAKVREWSEELQVDWAERAATLEYDQGNGRQMAEWLAFWSIKKERGI